MGHTAILVGSVALATGLICLLLGFLWGRSNLRSQVEDAVDMVRKSAEAREFDLREQLDQKMVELSEIRARVEVRPREQRRPEQPRLEQRNASAASESSAPKTKPAPVQKQEQAPAPVVDSTGETIQSLLKSMEERLKQTEEIPPAVAAEAPAPPKLPAGQPSAFPQQKPVPAAPQDSREAPRVAPSQSVPLAPATLPETRPAPAPQANPKPSQPKPAAGQRPAVKDEWQEFAASLEALKRQAK